MGTGLAGLTLPFPPSFLFVVAVLLVLVQPLRFAFRHGQGLVGGVSSSMLSVLFGTAASLNTLSLNLIM